MAKLNVVNKRKQKQDSDLLQTEAPKCDAHLVHLVVCQELIDG
ncbi:hypothetical protein [Iningainema tapete]